MNSRCVDVVLGLLSKSFHRGCCFRQTRDSARKTDSSLFLDVPFSIKFKSQNRGPRRVKITTRLLSTIWLTEDLSTLYSCTVISSLKMENSKQWKYTKKKRKKKIPIYLLLSCYLWYLKLARSIGPVKSLSFDSRQVILGEHSAKRERSSNWSAMSPAAILTIGNGDRGLTVRDHLDKAALSIGHIPVCECGESIPRWPSSGLSTGENVGALDTETAGGFSVLSFLISWCTGGGPVEQKRIVFNVVMRSCTAISNNALPPSWIVSVVAFVCFSVPLLAVCSMTVYLVKIASY